ncbi:PREDICTED: E3 ubiquitin-protein ligase NEURL3 [Nanorana parkeri]|uniref:E3 ubiquitin-protein ligase NEURL3 n=1 Tax=Nanorana parkeri TaxID=125878 RepID=UPI000854AB18|nr:PREDICTED: E3 ubiquitin-protein ligase NEURL3 [Nanorana parkeri]
MGLTCSSENDASELSFHPHCRGSHISLNCCLHQATRFHSFHDGLVFSNRPLQPREKVRIKVLEEELSWHGALRVGFTTVDPNKISASSLPPFACPNLLVNPGFWAIGIPEELCEKGAELCFWINRKGQALFQKPGSSQPKVLFSGIPKRTPVWVLLDIYGRTKTVKLINGQSKQTESHCCCRRQPSKGFPEKCTRGKSLSTLDITSDSRVQCLHKSTTMNFHSESGYPPFYKEDNAPCVICQDRLADTLLLPCLHSNFCEQCAVRVKSEKNLCPLCRQTIVQSQKVGTLQQLMEFLTAT